MKRLCITISVGLATFGCLGTGHVQAQLVDLKYAAYGSDTPAAGTAPGTATSTLGPVTVTQVFSSVTSSNFVYAYVTDSSGAPNYIYIPGSKTSPVLVGATYSGLGVTSAPFGGNLELTTTTTTFTPVTTGGMGMYTLVSEGAVTTTSPITDNYTPNAVITDLEPVQFTFTPATTQSTGTSNNLATATDANGDVINFYHAQNPTTFTAGTTYTIDGIAQATSATSGTIEIIDPTVIPEPSSGVLLGCGALGLMFVARRSKLA